MVALGLPEGISRPLQSWVILSADEVSQSALRHTFVVLLRAAMRPTTGLATPYGGRGASADRAESASIWPSATPSLSDLTMSYFSVDGLVSGIKSHMIEAPSKATAAILRNVVVWPKLAAIRPKTAVLRAAPIPDAVPMMP